MGQIPTKDLLAALRHRWKTVGRDIHLLLVQLVGQFKEEVVPQDGRYFVKQRHRHILPLEHIVYVCALTGDARCQPTGWPALVIQHFSNSFSYIHSVLSSLRMPLYGVTLLSHSSSHTNKKSGALLAVTRPAYRGSRIAIIVERATQSPRWMWYSYQLPVLPQGRRMHIYITWASIVASFLTMTWICEIRYAKNKASDKRFFHQYVLQQTTSCLVFWGIMVVKLVQR